jgi:hypothetical protein
MAACAGALLALIWILIWVRGMLKLRTPAGDLLNIQFRKYGDPESIAHEIEQDFTGQQFRTKRVHAGRRWICYVWKSQIIVRRTDNQIWAYLERVSRKLNGMIPMPSTNQVIVWNRNGTAAVMVVKRSEAYDAVDMFGKAAPWMLTGYSNALKESWNNDREDLIALVDKARSQGTSPPRIF